MQLLKTISSFFAITSETIEHYESQTQAIIECLRKTGTHGMSRSELGQIRVNGCRIANVTARITEARKILKDQGQEIVCIDLLPRFLKNRPTRIRKTHYFIRDICD